MRNRSLRFTLLLWTSAAWLAAQGSALAQTVLFSEDFNTDTSANWTTIGGGQTTAPDFTAQFGFDYNTQQFTRNGVTGTIPPAPNGGGRGVKLTVNKDDVADRAGVSIFPKDKTFTGSYALKFDMWLNYNGGPGGGSGSTEFATFGINHAGDKVIWGDPSIGDPNDGVWFAVSGEGGAAGDYRAYVGDGGGPALSQDASAGGFLDRDGSGTGENEVVYTTDGNPLYMLFPAPGFETRGMPSKRWVEVEVRQRANESGGHTVTWLINGYVIAEHSQGDLVGMTSGTVMLGTMDIYTSIANPRADNYVIYDNVRVVDLTNVPALPVVTVEATDAEAAEPSNPGNFRFTRHGSSPGPLTVSYRLEGTAANGTDYTSLPGTVTIPSALQSVDVALTPINDSLGEGMEEVRLVLTGSTNYDLYTNLSATITLADDGDVPVATVTAVKTNAYEGYAGNDGRFRIQLSNPNSTATTVQFQVSGSAVAGTDYTAIGTSVSIPAGATEALVRIRPINNISSQPQPRTVTLTLASGTGYELGTNITGTVGIRDDDFVATGALLYSENFDADHSQNWTINASGGDNPVDFFFDYSTVGIPPAPNTTGGTTLGAKLQANLSSGIFSGVSVSPLDLNLTGDYVLRLDLWQNFNGSFPGGGSGSTQLSGAGVGTSGTTPQWPGARQDSVWFATTGDGGSSVDYRAYSSAAGTGYTETNGVYAAGTGSTARNESDPYYAEFGGEPAPQAQLDLYPGQTGVTARGAQGMTWRDVVIQKRGNTVTWHIDGKLIATVPADATNFAGGNILLMHSDINAGSSTDPNAPAVAFGLFDNVRVYALQTVATAPSITGISVVDNGANVRIDFTGSASDTAADFAVHAAGVVTGPYAAANATITQVSPGTFRAVLPANGNQQFYRVRR